MRLHSAALFARWHKDRSEGVGGGESKQAVILLIYAIVQDPYYTTMLILWDRHFIRLASRVTGPGKHHMWLMSLK